MSRSVSLLTPKGEEIPVEPEMFRKLRKSGFLFWNEERGLRQIRGRAYAHLDLWRGQNPILPATVRAFDPSRQRNYRRPLTLADKLAPEYESEPAEERKRLRLLWWDDPDRP